MRVLLVTDFYHPHSGGVEVHVRAIAHHLAQRGHTVAVAALGADGRAQRSTDGPVEVFTVAHTAQVIGRRFRHDDRPWAPPFPDPLAMSGLRRVVRRFKPDVIHGHDWLARSVQPRLVSGRTPVITSLHYYTRSCAKKTLWRDGGICDGPTLALCARCAADHYGAARGSVVTVGIRVGSAIEGRRSATQISVSAATEAGNGLTGHPRSVVIDNPVPVATTIDDSVGQQADDPGRQQADEQALASLPDEPFILFVGDIRPEKGVSVLAEAMTVLRDHHGLTTPLVVAGERMSDRIDLPPGTVELGPVPHDTVQHLWRKALVGVIPSQWPEPFGLVAVEAMAAGCPIVASEAGGLADILGQGRAKLVPPGDVSALADGLAEVIGDPELRARLVTAASADIDRYRVDVVVDRIEEVYRSAAGRS